MSTKETNMRSTISDNLNNIGVFPNFLIRNIFKWTDKIVLSVETKHRNGDLVNLLMTAHQVPESLVLLASQLLDCCLEKDFA